MPMNSSKDFKARAVDVAQPLMAGGPVGGNQGGDYVLQPTPVYAIQERAICENPAAGPDGVGVRADDCAYTMEARTVPQAVAYSVALRGREGGAIAELGDDLAGCLRASTGGGDKPHVLAPVTVIQTRGSNIDIDDHVTGTLGSNCDRASGSAPMAMGAAFDILGTPASEVAKETDIHTPLRARTPGQFENSTVTMVLGEPDVQCVTEPVTHTLKAEGFDASEDGTGRGQPIINVTMAVRRLMPVECERLQGFPDNWTAVPVKKVKREKMKPGVHYAEIDGEIWQLAADGPRYKQCGNSMAVNVMHWIGARIAAELMRGVVEPANDNHLDAATLFALVA